jgi:glycosyltransferase involved in cell wall biosynthesis
LNNEYVDSLSTQTQLRIGRLIYSQFQRLCQVTLRRDFDAIWIQYELFPYMPGFFERLAFLSGKPVICDYDDAIFHMYGMHSNQVVRLALKRKLEGLLKRSAAAICGNSYLRSYVENFCANCVSIPTVVDTSEYKAGPEKETFVIGWMGSPSTWKYVQPLMQVLNRVCSEGGAKVRIVGAGARVDESENVSFIDWNREAEVADIQQMDIGIMPLPDDLWAKGKCGYKLVQYMACGLPVVASPVGVNGEMITDGANGFLASTEQQWYESLMLLGRNTKLRRRMGRVGRAKVEKDYSLAVHAPRLERLLREVAG